MPIWYFEMQGASPEVKKLVREMLADKNQEEIPMVSDFAFFLMQGSIETYKTCAAQH